MPEEPLAGAGRAPLHQDIATARDERRGGISIQTLTVAAAASAIASFTVSRIWGAGTVVSAALTPVLVALASEFLRRPVDHVSASAQRVVPVVAPALVRPSSARGQAPPAPTRPEDRASGVGRPPAPGEPPPSPSPPPQAEWAPVSYADPPAAAFRPRWRLVLMTGFLAFAIVVGFFTIPDLILGHSITGAGGSTTFFSGPSSPAPPTRTVTVQTTPTPTSTAATQPTVTVTVPTTTDTAPQLTPPPTDTTQTTPTTPTTQSAPTTPTTPGGP
ncbi:MAG: hypothetical protein QOE27_908 [Solirubrobacteraceae bacterium]|nr:hypothetical protein [Solirubrobacteraceae bacterium]